MPGMSGGLASMYDPGESSEVDAITGAAAGAGFNPVGAVIGAGVGAGTSLFDRQSQKKQAKKDMYPGGIVPKRRRASMMLDQMKDAQNRRLAAMGMLAQASFDWASSIR